MGVGDIMDIERAVQQAVSPVVLQVYQNENRHLPEWQFLFCCGVRPEAGSYRGKRKMGKKITPGADWRLGVSAFPGLIG